MGELPRFSLARRPFVAALASIPVLGSTVRADRSPRQVFVDERESAVTVGNELLEVTIGREYGGVLQLRAVGPALSLCDPDVEREPRHWRLTFYSDVYDELRADSYNARSPTIAVTEGDDVAELWITWTDIELTSPTHSGAIDTFDGTVESRVIVEAESPVVEWEFDVQNDGDRAIRSAACPYVNGIGSLDPDGDDELVLPQLIGKRIRNPTETGPDGISYPAGMGTMQFTSYTTRSGGFYTHARDTDGYAKELSWEAGRAQTVRYLMRHYVPRQPGADVSVPYRSTLGVLDGDWHDAADRYRDWLLEEGWLSTDEAGLPDWIHRRGAFFELTSYIRPNYPDPLEELPYREIVARMEALVESLDAPLELRWRGWQIHGRQHGLDWYPPREGVDAFEDALADLEALDVRVLGFISGSLGYEYADFWQENHDRAEDWVIRAADGSPKEMAYFPDHPEENVLYRIEFPHPDYQRAIRTRLETYAAAGGHGVNLDGFPWQWVPECYADRHEHPVGFGGNWYPRESRRGLRALVRAARAERPGFLLSGEGLSDFYLPYLQVAYYRAAAPERHLEVPETEAVELLPVLPYALGDFHAIRAATIFLGKEDFEYQNLAAARALVWGCIPVVNMDYPVEIAQRKLPTLAYLGEAARARSKYANRFVARGRMLRGPALDVGTVTTETITVEPGDETMTVWSPAVLSSAWRSDRGETGFVFTRVSPEEASRVVELDLASQPTWLPDPPWLAYTVTNGRYERLDGDVNELESITVALEPWDVAVVVIAPANETRERALELLIDAQRVAADAPAVERAKRQFERDELTRAIETARGVIDDGATPAPAESDTADSRSEGGGEPTTTSADAPGFTVLTGLAGAAAAIATRLRGGGREQS